MAIRTFTHLASDPPPERAALIEGRTGRTSSYQELTRAVGAFATGLRQRGLRPGGVVATLLGNGVPFAVAYHGTLYAGGTVQPLDPLAPPAQWARAISASGARWLVADRDSWQRLTRTPEARCVEYVVITDEDGAGDGRELSWVGWARLLAESPAADGPPPLTATPEDVAVLASSSGTEGPVKHVVLTHGNLTANLEQIHARHRLTREDVVMAVTPWRHIYGMQMAMNHALLTGATLVTMGSPFRLQEFLELTQRHRATAAYLVPGIIAELAEHVDVTRYDLSSLRFLFSGGDVLPPAVAEACSRRLGVPVYQGYGMTEAGCTHLVPDGMTTPAGSIGLPLPRTDVRIADPDTGEPCSPGRTGELWVRGPQISPGYLHDEHATARLLTPDGWLRTGDLARSDENGFCTITGRRKELIKYKGHQVAPAELEAVLLTHPAVTDAAVVGVPHRGCGELPKAFVVLARQVPLRDITDHVAERVAPHHRIRLIESVASLPRSPSGKLIRSALTAGAARPGGNPAAPLAGRTVLLTGAGGGLGRAFAACLADAGANLVLTGRDPGKLNETAAELETRQVRALAVPADVTDPDALPRVVERAMTAFGTIDVLVNNAGVPGPHGALWDTDPAEWWEAMEVNLHGTIRACRAVLPVMTARRSGRVINIVSAAGRHRWPHASAYSVSKAAVIKLTENLAPELRPHGVAVFSYHPGLLDLGFTRDHLDRHPSGNPWTDRIGEWLQKQRAEGRFTSPRRATETLLRLAEGQADELSGSYLTAGDDIPALVRRQRDI
ncbi:SDR family NAD(P)-dependent oxidoreductase [Streptomyces sp. P1-3]|uniref:SDR family NAD(P)-dependent oxidoreductase n=1 Tax=Streptomyces sp. P1-3 TaxID=3421658 RepID=UPI003D362086